jgi:uncharacterized protein (TIGR00369 family)
VSDLHSNPSRARVTHSSNSATQESGMKSVEEKVRESFKRQTFMATLGAEISSVLPGAVEIRMPFHKSLVQQNGYMHAGAITSILDSACGYAALSVAPENCDVLSVEFKVNLLAPGLGEYFVARSQVKRAGRTLTVCTADGFAIESEQEKLVATMQATIINLPQH